MFVIKKFIKEIEQFLNNINLKYYLIYFIKLLISFLIEFLIIIGFFYRFVCDLIFKVSKLFSKILIKRNFSEEYISLVIFKSGTMGDHLLCMDSLNYFNNILIEKIKIKKFIICKPSSAFREIIELSNNLDIKIINYLDFIKIFLLKFINSKEKIVIIDSEPKFRIGLLVSLLIPNASVVSNYRIFADKFIEKYTNKTFFNYYDENKQEAIYISKLILKGFSNLNLIPHKNINFEIEDYKNSFIFRKNIFIHKATKEHDSHIKNLSNKKNIIYLYYGCSGKALHRLPSLDWFKNFYNLLVIDYNVLFVGGPNEEGLLSSLGIKEKASLSFINKFSLLDWSYIFTESEHQNIPLISFDGGFSHLFGIHSPFIYQVFCSSNNWKWGNKSPISGVYSCMDGGSPDYKPYLFKVPEECSLAERTWVNLDPKEVFDNFLIWYEGLQKFKN